ncbi:hypothetical protein [Marinivivus vitaminiproducens]|uniref:hypothetical protein n=1 Tax=Marinivivus vitaminiproducens TaxID=3035935 RepID=UPI0027991131|nr:hypothetical protein P4R82_08805 [Geminicoccaceae bacterium SCSIO 64248]
MAAVAMALAGCAANLEQGDAGAPPLRVEPTASRNIVLNVTGSPVATGSEDWQDFKGEWTAAMEAAATARGARFGTQDGEPRATGQAGTLVVVDVEDYRYMSTGARFGLGAMAGNAYVDADVRFLDLASGTPLGRRSYTTSSSAWEGVFSAMTSKQVGAIADAIVAEIDPR